MIRECFDTKTGILFKAVKLRTAGLEPATLYPEVIKRNFDYDTAGRLYDTTTGKLYDTTGRFIRDPETPTQVTERHRDTWEPYKDFERDHPDLDTVAALRRAQADGPLPHGQVRIPDKITERGDVFHYMVCHNECVGDPTEPVNEDEQDVEDCLAPYYDQYELKWWWSLLEWRLIRSRLEGFVIVLPLMLDPPDRLSFLSLFGVRSPGDRTIPDGAYVHRSVEMRMKSAGFERHPSTMYKIYLRFAPAFVRRLVGSRDNGYTPRAVPNADPNEDPKAGPKAGKWPPKDIRWVA